MSDKAQGSNLRINIGYITQNIQMKDLEVKVVTLSMDFSKYLNEMEQEAKMAFVAALCNEAREQQSSGNIFFLRKDNRKILVSLVILSEKCAMLHIEMR